MRAIADTVTQELLNISREIENVLIYSRIDELPETLIDILAYDMHVDWYDYSFPLDVKRNILKNSVKVHKRMGTKYAVEKALSALYPQSKVTEWFEYGGEPGNFRIYIDITDNYELTDKKRLIKVINTYKRLSAHLEELYYEIKNIARQEVTYNERIKIISGFYPRYNVIPFFLNGRTRLDGTYYLNGYLSGETLDFYPVTLRMIAGADWRAGNSGMAPAQLYLRPWVQLEIGNDADLRIWSAARAKAQITISRLFLQGSANAGTQISSQLMMQGTAEEDIKTETLPQLIADAEMEISQESALQMRTSVGENCKVDGSLVVEKDLWRLNGSVMLDGSRILDAEIYTEEI